MEKIKKFLELKRFMKFKKFTNFAPFLSVLILGSCVIAALQDYEAAAYDVAALESVMEETEMQTEQDELDDAQPQDSEPESETDESGMVDLSELADGTYEGEGTGFGGKIRVSVEIKDHKIVSVEIISASGEDASFLERAKGVIGRILTAQSLEVDTVSGATYSSRGIVRAVKNALSGEEDDGQTAGVSSSSAGTASLPSVIDNSTYQDGVYIGSGKGFAGDIKVRVTITDGKIASIEIVSSSDGAAYIEKASAVITNIINAQSTNVDAVSGATYSSAGIVSAVRAALAKAQGEAESEDETSAAGAFPYEDGIYYGTAAGFSGDLTVAVALQEKTIKAILVTETADDTSYLNRAKAIADEIIKKQSTEVDTVSGATYSSKGIRQAVKEALKAAKKGTDGKGDGESGKKNEGSVTGTIPYKEGVYFGTGTGFQGDVEVAISISDKTIKSIVVTKTEDDEKFFTRARTVIDQILKKQSVKVDAVSGATYSSKGIIAAVKDALAKAKKATKNPGSNDNSPENNGDGTTQESEDAVTGTIPYKEGVYFGTGTGFQGDIEVAIAISEKTIKAIVVTKTEDDEKFFTRARTVIDQILKKQSINVDAVSGATYSSKGIIAAVGDALARAKKATENSSADDNSPEDNTENPGNDTEKPENPEKTEDSSGTVYQDGTYQVSVVCYPDEGEEFESYTLSATVTIKQDKIVSVTNITGDGGSENNAFIKRAANGTNKKPGVVTQIVEKGDVQGVDAVSAATCSSQAILDACSQALQKAKK